MTSLHLQGIGASPGIATGSVYYYEPQPLTLPEREPNAPADELARFTEARATAQKQLESLRTQTEATIGIEEAQIFEAHTVLLNDPMFEEAVQDHIQGGATVESAVHSAVEQLAEMLRSSGDPLFAERAADVLDMGARMLRVLLGVEDNALMNLTTPVIIAAADLTPSDTAGLNPQLVQGIILAGGGKTSHAAILARTLGIPAVVGIGDENLQNVQADCSVVLDGTVGEIIINPTPAVRSDYAKKRAQQQARHAEMQRLTHKMGRTASGRRLPVQANAGELASVQEAAKSGAEGIGLLRTEFLYMSQSTPPDEEQQVQTYRAIFAAMGSYPVTIRTLDVGGDKPPRFLDFPTEDNPFLGWRGVRVSLDHPDLLKTQLRAILLAAAGFDVSIMFPMVDSVETFREAKAIYDDVRAQLTRLQHDFARDVYIGTMIETPAAAVLTELLARECDFFSIGTNDLTQYTHAADRNNPRVSRYFNDFSPAVLRLIKQTIDAAHTENKPVSVCGELAGNPLAIPVLVGLGVDKLSMVSGAIPQAKWLLSRFTDIDLEHIALRAMMTATSAELRDYMTSVLETHEGG